MAKKTKAVPFIDSKNILHYWDKNGALKTFDLSNENVKKQAIKAPGGIGRTAEDGSHLREYLPKEVCKALLQTREYKWTRGDRFTDYLADVYHKCWEVNKDKPNYENIEHCGNVASNPCYGWIRYKLKEGGYTKGIDCPRCEAMYAIYNTYKPLKWKLWDSLLWIRDFFHWTIFHNIYKDAETFFFTKSREGRKILKGWQEVMKEGEIGELVYWRKHYLKPLLKKSDLTFIENKRSWYIYNPKLYSEEEVKNFIEKNKYCVIWEYEDWVRQGDNHKILVDKDWERE